jgi:hypothetical protein
LTFHQNNAFQLNKYPASLCALEDNALPNRDVTVAKRSWTFGGRRDILAFYVVWGGLIGGFELNF